MIEIEKLVEAGVHFGHRVSRWNPKMNRYIYGRRNLIHIIDLVETMRGLLRAQRFLRNVVAGGHKIVLVGTKRQIKNVVASEAERCKMPFVNERWLGGTLTNFTTVRSRLKRLKQLETMEEDGTMATLPKKAQSFLQRELRRIRRNLDGIRDMDRLPGAVVVIDTRKEYIAVNEANRLGIPIVAILDTDCDPTLVDFPIPGNDDAMRSVQVLLGPLIDSVMEGAANARELKAEELRAMTPGEEDEIQSVRSGQRPRGGPRGGGAPSGGGSGGGGGSSSSGSTGTAAPTSGSGSGGNKSSDSSGGESSVAAAANADSGTTGGSEGGASGS